MECQNKSPINTMTIPIVMSNFPMNIECIQLNRVQYYIL